MSEAIAPCTDPCEIAPSEAMLTIEQQSTGLWFLGYVQKGARLMDYILIRNRPFATREDAVSAMSIAMNTLDATVYH